MKSPPTTAEQTASWLGILMDFGKGVKSTISPSYEDYLPITIDITLTEKHAVTYVDLYDNWTGAYMRSWEKSRRALGEYNMIEHMGSVRYRSSPVYVMPEGYGGSNRDSIHDWVRSGGKNRDEWGVYPERK